MRTHRPLQGHTMVSPEREEGIVPERTCRWEGVVFEILLMGLVVIVVYAISHFTVVSFEKLLGKPLGIWRSALFFLVFLALFLIFNTVLSHYLGPPKGTPL